MRSPRVLLGVVLAVFCSSNLYATYWRSGIPHELSGRVEGIERRLEKHPGLDDVYLVRLEGRTVHLDVDLAGLFVPGTVIEKPAWGREMVLRGRRVTLAPSRDFRGMVIAMPCALLVGAWLLLGGRRRPRGLHAADSAGPDGSGRGRMAP